MQDASNIAQTNGKAQDNSSNNHHRTNKRSSRRKPCHVYVPASFDPAKTLPPALHKHADAARYFLHRIIWGDILKQRTLEKFVPLKFEYLRTVIPDRVIKPMKDALVGEGVIECDGFYVEGEKSFAYRLGLDYRSDRIVQTTVDGSTAERVRANRLTEYKRIRLPVHKWLRKKFRCLEVDLPRVLELLSNDPNYEINKIPVEQISSKEVEFSFCSMGRIHTCLTRCPKVVRPALHVSGEPLVGLDIANSQPLFLSLVVINYRKRGNKLFGYPTYKETPTDPYRDIDRIVQETVSYFKQKEQETHTTVTPTSITNRIAIEQETESVAASTVTTATTSPRQSSVNSEFLKADERAFVKHCETNTLYGLLQDWADIPVRDRVKKELFLVLYGKNSLRSDLKATFRELFPHVAQVIRVHKAKDHTFLSRLMQNIESNFMISTVCRRIMIEIPDAPVFTIHDSILTTAPFVEAIRGIMIEEFARLGISPTLHDEDYSKDYRSNHQKLSEAL
jgi:hypothetical protein